MPTLRFNNPFRHKGLWFKGNLHSHTTVSDGKLTPKQLVYLYKNRGYSFLALTALAYLVINFFNSLKVHSLLNSASKALPLSTNSFKDFNSVFDSKPLDLIAVNFIQEYKGFRVLVVFQKSNK